MGFWIDSKKKEGRIRKGRENLLSENLDGRTREGMVFEDHFFSSRFHVVDDPPQYKIGSGGSTLLVLKYLDDIYGTDLDSSTSTSYQRTCL